jgi:hypothetical protein
VDTLGSRPADDAEPAPVRAGGPDDHVTAGGARDGADGANVQLHRRDDKDDSDVPWAGIGVVMLVLVTGAFASGWHLGRRWGRLMGW